MVKVRIAGLGKSVVFSRGYTIRGQLLGAHHLDRLVIELLKIAEVPLTPEKIEVLVAGYRSV